MKIPVRGRCSPGNRPQLNGDPRIDWYSVKVESEESIHNHNAFATVEKEV